MLRDVYELRVDVAGLVSTCMELDCLTPRDMSLTNTLLIDDLVRDGWKVPDKIKEVAFHECPTWLRISRTRVGNVTLGKYIIPVSNDYSFVGNDWSEKL